MSQRGLHWDDVRFFLAIAREGGIAAAAAALKVSEATIGRRLGFLEQALGARLFERLPNRLAATPLAERLLGSAAAMEEQAATLERLAQAGTRARSEPVRITATTSVAVFLARHMGRLLVATNGLRIELLATRNVQNLARREAELALRMRRPPEHGHLALRRVGQVAFTLYASCDYLACHGSKPLEHPDQLRFIRLRPDPASRQARWLDEVASGAAMPVRLGEVPLRLEAARRGIGVTLLPCWLGDAEPSLQRLLAPPPELVEDLFLLVHEDLRDLPAVRAVGDALADLIRAPAGALSGRGAGTS